MIDVPVLDVADLTVTARDGAHPVRGLGFRLYRGDTYGIVGETGSGGHIAAHALLGLRTPGTRVTGSVRLLGRELVGLGEAALSSVRGNRIAMFLADPLSPVHTISAQIGEAIGVHHSIGRAAARHRAGDILGAVGVSEPGDILDAYAYEVSPELRQRVALALAVANEPDVIIAVEPTAGLDVTAQATILDTLATARAAIDAALVLVTPDLGVIAGHVQRVQVMYAGRPVESGTVDEVFHTPRMPYTVGLLGGLPRLDHGRRGRLATIPGTPTVPATGCSFAPRCPLAENRCRTEEPPERPIDGGPRTAACHFAERLADTTGLYGEER